jgi:hypothetical protein
MTRNMVVGTVLALTLAAVGRAQEEKNVFSFVPQAEAPKAYSILAPTAPLAVQWKEKSKTSGLEKAWREADNEDDRDGVRRKAHKYLNGRFNVDMKRREKELEQIEVRVRRLRSQLEKRVAKKDEIIELQLKQMTMSWDGLGWSEPAQVVGGTAFAFPQPPQVPAVPSVATVRGLYSQARDKFDASKSQALVKKIMEAAEDNDNRSLKTLASKLAEEAEDMEPYAANEVIWKVFEALGEEVEQDKFWLMLAGAAENVADQAEAPTTMGNILDTAAHCYHLGGKTGKAIELQLAAVEASTEANDGEPNPLIQAFLDELMSDNGEDDEDSEEERGSIR